MLPFINPAIFLTGLAAVSIPIIIYLINRRRYRRLDWAAMKFLLEALKKNKRRLRIEELILLAIRCLVVLLIGMALGRFTGCNTLDSLALKTGSSEAVVFLLDDSASFGQRIGSDMLFKGACSDLSDRINKMPPSTQVAILLTSHPDPASPFCPLDFITDKQSVETRLSKLEPSDTRTDFAQSLASAGKLVAGTKVAKRRLIVMSDCRKNDFDTPEQKTAIRKQFEQLTSEKVDVIVLDYGRDAKKNLTFEKIELLDRSILAGQPARIGLDLHNNGLTTVDSVEVQLDGRTPVKGMLPAEPNITLPVQRFDAIRPGETKRIEFEVTCPIVGPASIRARMASEGDELKGDDTIELALNVRKAVKALVVDGGIDVSDPTDSESFYLTRALDPNRNGDHGISPEVISPEAMGEVRFEDYDMVVLVDVPSFPATTGAKGQAGFSQLDQLEAYAQNGGCVAIFVGDKIDTNFYNGRLFNNGAGLSPFPLLKRIEAGATGSAYEKVRYFTPNPKGMAADQMVRVFTGETAKTTGFVHVFDFYRADEGGTLATAQGAKPARVLARFSDDQGSPFIALRQLGAGVSVMFYTAAAPRSGNSEWSDWPKEEDFDTFLTVMWDMFLSCSRQQPSLSDRVGRPLAYQLPADMQDVRATLKTPKYPVHDLVALQPQKGLLKYDMTTEAGTYVLDLAQPGGASTQMLFSRYVDPAEGDLKTAGKDGLAAAFGSDKFAYSKPREAGSTESGPIHDYWQWVIAALLALIALEVFLAQRFGHYV
jgi:hypothetical protein